MYARSRSTVPGRGRVLTRSPRGQPGLSLLLHLAVHVQAAILDLPTLLVVRLRGRAELVADDAVCLTLLDESQRYEALFFEEPNLQILAAVLQTTILMALTRPPLVKRTFPFHR